MILQRRLTSYPCFSAPPFLSVPKRIHHKRILPIRTKPQRFRTIPACTAVNASIVILGGSSGVGKEAARYLELNSVPVNVVSRRTGYDIRNQADIAKALAGHTKAAISVGAGRRGSSPQDEVELYRIIAHVLSSTFHIELTVVILRSLILPEVQRLFHQSVKIPWVFIRPGPLVDKEEKPGASYSEQERVLVTADIRCNGLVSRAAVGKVVGDLLLGKVPLHQINRQVFGVYDVDRMINHPQGIEVLGADIWQ